VPAAIEDAARRRAEARAARDWETADRLRAEIEAAGWRVIDAGVRYRVERASPASIEVGGEIRYGRSEDVPSRLDEPLTGLASVIFLASGDKLVNRRSLAALDDAVPAGVDVVVVADGVDVDASTTHEVLRTSAPLGRGAALNIGIRRARAAIVIAIDSSIVPSGDVITPLVDVLRDPTVAVAGPFGLVSSDLRLFNEAVPSGEPVDVTAVQGELIAFRRADAAGRGPIDEGFRISRYLDVWLSLVLRDEGEDRPARRAVAVPGLALERGEPVARPSVPSKQRDRLSKRSFYRLLDRFRTRLDLAVPP